MEPAGPLRRVSGVDAAFATNEIPVIRLSIAADTTTSGEFEAFYRRERPSVARALRLTLRDDQLAEEATDEAMARAFERWHTVRGLDNPGGWAYRVALNWARSVLRRRSRRRNEPVSATVFDDPQPRDFELHRALTLLDIDHRAVIVCRYFLEWSEQETSAALGIRPGTVKSRLHRALRELERRLTPARPLGDPRSGSDGQAAQR